ncbi:MAG: hypothetical protein ABI120_19615 [Gemmatimonadaceae bacterium]
MSEPMPLDDFLSAQGSGFTATIEAIAEKPMYVKVTPWRESGGCGCASSLELPRDAIKSVKGTGQFHFCCGKRLEVAVVDFNDDASIPLADVLEKADFFGRRAPGGSVPPNTGPGAPVQLRGRWRIPWTRCTVTCIDVCTHFCGPTGFDCCGWSTRCGVTCDGPFFDPLDWLF